MTSLILLLFIIGFPALLSGLVCERRNRSAAKGLVATLLVGIFTGGLGAWLCPIGFWLALKRRDRHNPTVLY